MPTPIDRDQVRRLVAEDAAQLVEVVLSDSKRVPDSPPFTGLFLGRVIRE